jgi:hypothetical protein
MSSSRSLGESALRTPPFFLAEILEEKASRTDVSAALHRAEVLAPVDGDEFGDVNLILRDLVGHASGPDRLR